MVTFSMNELESKVQGGGNFGIFNGNRCLARKRYDISPQLLWNVNNDNNNNLKSAIKLRISTYSAGQPDREFVNPVDKARRQTRLTSSTSTISHAVSAKLEDGNVRAAIRLLMSEAVNALREKHPPSSSVLTDLPPCTSTPAMCIGG